MLFRITRVKKTLDNFEMMANFHEKQAGIYELFCMIYYVVLGTHFCACTLSLMARIEKEHYNYEHTWFDEYAISDEDWKIKYLYSIYWTAITTMTVGYGDIVPQTNPERVYVTFITFIVSGVFAYVISSIGNIFNKI